jgi:hypothetical protein
MCAEREKVEGKDKKKVDVRGWEEEVVGTFYVLTRSPVSGNFAIYRGEHFVKIEVDNEERR